MRNAYDTMHSLRAMTELTLLAARAARSDPVVITGLHELLDGMDEVIEKMEMEAEAADVLPAGAAARGAGAPAMG